MDYRKLYAATVDPDIKVMSADEKMAIRQREQIRLNFGDPNPEYFPNREIAEAFHQAVEKEPDQVLQYGAGQVAEGLRDFLRNRAAARDMSVTREQLLVTSGASEALDLIGRVFLDPGDVMYTEAPTFMGALTLFRRFGVNISAVEMDDQGLDTHKLERRLHLCREKGERSPKLLYVIPNFQNPTGVTMSLQRRRHLLRLAEQYNFLVIEDGAYGELRYEGCNLPTLWELSGGVHVLHVGTFSKVIAPGIRLGWVFANPTLRTQISAIRPGYGNGMSESAVAEYCRSVDFDERVKQLRKLYSRRRDAMVSALTDHMPESAEWNRPEGGLFVWLKLPDKMDAADLASRAQKRGVSVLEGSIFYPEDVQSNCLRLSYSMAPADHMREAVKTLADLIQEAEI